MFEQLVVGGKVELFKKSRRIKENGETKEMLVSQIMDINDETIIYDAFKTGKNDSA